jgi:hypothetical protein
MPQNYDTLLVGRGFSERNLEQMRKFYILFSQIPQTVSGKFELKLSWSHYCELLKVEEPLARKFYEQEAIQNNWSMGELKRRKEFILINKSYQSNKGFNFRQSMYIISI